MNHPTRFTFEAREVLYDLQAKDAADWANLWALIGAAEAAHESGDDGRALSYLDQASDLEYDLTGDCAATNAAANEIGRELTLEET